MLKLNNLFILKSIPFILIMLTIGCTAYKPFTPPPLVPDDRRTSSPPVFQGQKNDFTDFTDQQLILQGDQLVDLSHLLRWISGHPKEAFNITAFDEAPNSSWFTNRHGQKRMTIEELVRGPNVGNGPDTSNTWTIVRAKAEGVTPGFTIVDSRGDKYVIKFDPVGYAGLNSGAEVIGSRMLYAMGYSVPENFIAFFDPRILKLGDKVKILDEKGRNRFMNEGDLADILARVDHLPGGLIRCTASKYVPGKVIGPFYYQGYREDDANDVIPHEHRRELRGYRVISAFMNNIDAKGANSMDTYITEDGQSFVRHYLIDFGTFFGSGGRGPQPIYRGYENEMDPKAFLWRILTLGLYVPDWEKASVKVDYPCIGRYDSEFFHPVKFKPIFPNPAFDAMTDRDGYWGAKLVMTFTDAELEAIIAEAKYPDPAASAHLLKNMLERRDRTGRYWFERMPPLDRFRLDEGTEEGGHELLFDDLAVETGLDDGRNTVYQYRMRRNGIEVNDWENVVGKRAVPLFDLGLYGSKAISGTLSGSQWEITMRLKRAGVKKWSRSVRIYLHEDRTELQYKLIGLVR